LVTGGGPPPHKNGSPPMKIVVAYNESEDARAAVGCAAEIARRSGGSVDLVYAVPAPAIPSFAKPAIVDELMSSAEAAARKLVEGEAARLAARGVQATAHVRRWLAPDTVIDRAKSLGADLVVVGRRGSSRLTQLMIGTVSSEIVRLSPVSVLVVRKDDVLHESKVLVAVDGSPHGVRALVVARATFPGSPLVACHVAHDGGKDPNAVVAESITAARLDPKSVTTRLLRGHPAAGLLAELAKEDSDAIVLGPRGLNLLEGLLLGSVTEKVLQLAKKPVLVAR